MNNPDQKTELPSVTNPDQKHEEYHTLIKKHDEFHKISRKFEQIKHLNT